MKTPKFALLRWMMAMMLVLVSVGNNFVFYIGSVSADYDEGLDTPIVSEDVLEESDADDVSEESTEISEELDDGDVSEAEESSDDDLSDDQEEFADVDIVFDDESEGEIIEEDTVNFALQAGEMNLMSQGVLQNFSWTGTDLTPGATGVTYIFSYTTQTEVPAGATIFRYFFSGNGRQISGGLASVSVTIDGSPATLSLSTFAAGDSFWIRLMSTVPAGSDVVVTLSNMTNHYRPVVSPTTTVVTQHQTGLPNYDVAPSDAEPIVLPAKTLEELIDRCDVNSGDINIPYAECVGLAHLYIETDGQMSWRNNDNWFVDTDVTTWRANYCNEPNADYYQGNNTFCNGYPFTRQYIDWDWYIYAIALTGSGPVQNIYGIQLPGNNLQGSIVSGLNSFPELTYLSLEDNNLSFVDISQNPKLKYLRIGNNNSSNPWILDLDNNPLLEYVTLDDLGLESLILDHQYLYYLDVDGNDFIFFDVTNLPSLISLDASDNYDMTSITGFNGKQYLQYLGFEESAISGHVDFADMPLLRTIRVEYNQITSVSFVNLPALEYLNMEGNMLASIDLSNLSSLQTVALYDNQLTSVTLLNLPLLSYLYLAGNMLTDEGFDFVPANQHMQDIYLNNNNFNSFPSSLLSLDSLNGFDISRNCIDIANLSSAVLAWLDYNVNWYYVNNQQYCVSVDLDGTVQGDADIEHVSGWLGGGDWGASYDMEVIRNGYLGDFIGLPGNAHNELVYTWDTPVNVSSVVVYWQAGPNNRDPRSYYFSYRDDQTDTWINPSTRQADNNTQDFRTRHIFDLPSSVTTTKVRLVRPQVGGQGGVGLSQFLVYAASQSVVVPPSSGCSGCGGVRSILLSHGSAMTIPQTIASRLLSNYWNGQSISQIQENISRLIYLNKQIQAKESVSVDMKELFVAVIYELIQRFAVMKKNIVYLDNSSIK